MKDALGQVKALTHVEGNLSCGEHAGSKMLDAYFPLYLFTIKCSSVISLS
jgi:hypothetical protein